MKLSSLRWSILVVFVIYLVTTAYDEAASLTLVGLALLALAACALLLSVLKGLSWQNLWAWIVLFVFVDGYYVKTLVLASKIDSPQEVRSLFPDLRWVSREVVMDGQVWMTAAFITYAMISWFLLSLPGSPREGGRFDESEAAVPDVSARRLAQLSCAVFGAYLLVSLVQNNLGLGVLGDEASGGIIGTVLTRFRGDLTPAVLVLCLWLQVTKRSRWGGVTVAYLLGASLVDSLISTSRGSIPRFLLPVIFLWLITGRFRARQVGFSLCAVLIMLILFPLVSGLRSSRIAEISSTARAATSGPPPSLLDSASLAVLRVQGAEGIWLSLNNSPSGFDPGRAAAFLAQGSNSRFYTREVVGVVLSGDNRAPGIVGGFMLLGPVPVVMALMALFTVLVRATWMRLARMSIAPVALSLFGGWLVYFTSEGSFYLANMAVLAIVVILCDLLYRKVLLPPADIVDMASEQARMTGSG